MPRKTKTADTDDFVETRLSTFNISNPAVIAQNLMDIAKNPRLRGEQKSLALDIDANSMNHALSICLLTEKNTPLAASCLSMLSGNPEVFSRISPDLIAQTIERTINPLHLLVMAHHAEKEGNEKFLTLFNKSFRKLDEDVKQAAVDYSLDSGLSTTVERLKSLRQANRPVQTRKQSAETAKLP